MDAHARTTDGTDIVEEVEADCVVVGGGPAGLMLGVLLARRGVHVVVLERHADFLRDFRGDTVHPSTQDVLAELGLLDAFLELPHEDMDRVTMRYAGTDLVMADLRGLPTIRSAIAFMPQWDLLDLLARAGAEHAGFSLRMRTRATSLVREHGEVCGVEAVGPHGRTTLRARLVVAADGRDSAIRAAAGLQPRAIASAFDVLWFRAVKQPDQRIPFLHAGDGALIAIDRGDFWQVAVLVARGGWSGSDADLAGLRARVARIQPALADGVAALAADDVHLLRVRLERLRSWHVPGLLAIGDAAHAMSPAGGVGINLAVQDAVATANLLGAALTARRPTRAELHAVQRRRALPAAVTQRLQRTMQPVLLAERVPQGRLPIPLRLLRAVPGLRRLLGRLVGMGVRPEHVAGAEVRPSAR